MYQHDAMRIAHRTRFLRKRRPRSAGFSLVEIAATLSFTSVALVGLGTLFLYTTRSTDEARLQSVLTHRLRFLSETIRSTTFQDVAAIWRDQVIEVPELEAQAEVTVFVNEVDTSADAVKLGFPRDLNGDGVASDPDVSDAYTLLPIRIRITWPQSGNMRAPVDHYFFLSQEE